MELWKRHQISILLPGNFGGDDVGSWLAVGEIKENDDKGKVVNGNVVTRLILKTV